MASIVMALWLGIGIYLYKEKIRGMEEKISLAEQKASVAETGKESAEDMAKEEAAKRAGEEIAREEAERLAAEETFKRIQEEAARGEAEKIAAKEAAKRTHEELEKKIAEQKLSAKEAEERRLSADNDKDGLTLREEEKKGTSDLSKDSDNDGIDDGQDLHPAGGGTLLPQNFKWEYEGSVWDWTYEVHEDWYEYYKNQPRTPHSVGYITYDDPFIKEIAKALKETADKQGYHLSSFLVSFVQGLPYVEDYHTSFDDYPKYPIETFISRNGDCEDTSYLFASLSQAAGLGAALIQFNNHMGVGIKTIHEQSGYYYATGNDWFYYYETTGEGWGVGELPDDYLYEKAKVTRIWDKSIHYLYPQYQEKPCKASANYYGYYTRDEVSYYRDNQCGNLTTCLPSLYASDKYYQSNSYYWNSDCTQKVVTGCNKSKEYPEYFYRSGIAWYYDSQCTQLYQSMSCDYPSSSEYICIYDSSYNLKKDMCDLQQSSTNTQYLAEDCYAELLKCRDDINKYQVKLNEYNKCIARKEY